MFFYEQGQLIKAGLLYRLVGVGETTHTRHHTENVVVGSVNTDLGGSGAGHRGVGHDQLQRSVVDTTKVARTARLVLLRTQGEGVDVDTRVGGTGVVLVGLNEVKVGTLTLGKAVLTVELQLGSDNRVLAPAVEVKTRLSQNKRTGVGHK